MKLLNKKKSRAQTMVEFALVLPILMMLIFGLLEVGRMAFIYITIATASREAVRYGSATGYATNSDGTIKIDPITGKKIFRYQDCDDIREAAQNVNFLNAITNANIIITYDQGPGTGIIGDCQGGLTPPSSNISGARINVLVMGDFEPIVGLVPLSTRTVANGNPITSFNSHTLIGSASVPVTWGGDGSGATGGGGGGTEGFPEVTDRCNNIEGDQSIIPIGMVKDASGGCFTIPESGDVCPNINGNQSTLPPGWFLIAGDCIAPTTDMCPNLASAQLTIPEGYILDNEGNCIINPDVCANIDGIQQTVPDDMYIINGDQCVNVPTSCDPGFVRDSNGNCVEIQDLCNNIDGLQGTVPIGSIRRDDGSCVPTPQCTFGSTGDIPLVIARGDSSPAQTTWTINNTSSEILTIDSIYITWNATHNKLFLTEVSFGNYQVVSAAPNISVSGYNPIPSEQIWKIESGMSVLTSLTFEYQNPPQPIEVGSVIAVTFNQAECKFEQAYCTLPNMLESNCEVQRR